MYTPDFSDPAYDRFWPESWRRKKFLAAGKKIKSGVPPLRALQEVDADELSTNDELVRLCEDLKAHGFSHPFEDDAYPFPKLLWLEVLKEAKNRHIDLGDKEDTLKYLDDLAESRFSLPIQSKPKQQLRIEALEPIPDLLNLTQLSWYEAANVIFTGDAAVSVKNLLPSQGIDLVNFRLLQISPPMKAVKAYKPSTLDAVLKRIDFGEDVPSTLLGGKTADVRLFKVTRPLAAKTLKDIKIEFYGKWPEGYYSVFTPQDRHQLVVEVTGSGASREEATFEFHFSCKENESVFSIKTIRSAVGKA